MAKTNQEAIEQLEAAATKPKQVTVDGVTVQGHSIADLIALDKHIAAKKAAQRGGMRIQKIVPPGTA
ncbi:hypothetical protein ACYFX5_09140 [Bremerella sp. T1]|uniref:hypothetical protein n=1 Tax=Bremerella sp. TYQ1 TaxID=3119568 RepID=UPI001CCAC1C2|nr:hypothetical protein [Bremerella volcania]UBM38417.1 hypothetical protein LA756_11075 [Bremerella volcania]